MNPEADFDSYIKTLRKSLENDALEQKIAEGWDEGRREKAGLRSLHGDLGQPRVRAVISVGQAWIGAEKGLLLRFQTWIICSKLDFSALILTAVFSPGQKMRHPGLYIIEILMPATYLPVALTSALRSIMPVQIARRTLSCLPQLQLGKAISDIEELGSIS